MSSTMGRAMGVLIELLSRSRSSLKSLVSNRFSRRSAGLVWLCFMLTGFSAAQVNVTTYHNTKLRSGNNILETILTPGNVNSAHFGKLFAQAVDGFLYAQPLYLSDVAIPGLGIHNVVYVATMNDSVYALRRRHESRDHGQAAVEGEFRQPCGWDYAGPLGGRRLHGGH